MGKSFTTITTFLLTIFVGICLANANEQSFEKEWQILEEYASQSNIELPADENTQTFSQDEIVDLEPLLNGEDQIKSVLSSNKKLPNTLQKKVKSRSR